jgi:hypothetical protein
MGSVINVAKLWARQGLRNSAFAAQLETRYNSLLEQSIAEGGLDKVTSATKNGVSMAKQVGLSVPEAMEAMELALGWIQCGNVPVMSRSYGRFF